MIDIKNLLSVELPRIFEENKDLIIRNGWIVGPANSYEWWGGLDSADKIVISAILVQMTRWEATKRAIDNLFSVISKVEDLYELSLDRLEELIKNVNYYKTKAIRLKELSRVIRENGGLKEFLNIRSRDKLLSIKGIGEETADSILLFAGHIPVFPPSNYGMKVLSKVLGIYTKNKHQVKEIIESNVKPDTYKYKLIHAGLVSIGKSFCYISPKCNNCILKNFCTYYIRGIQHETLRV